MKLLCAKKVLLLLAFLFCAAGLLCATETNSLVWQADRDSVSADIHGETLWPLLEDIAHQTGWHIFVEPNALKHNASVKFKDLPAGDALHKLLGDLNFALVPQTNGPQQLYVFTTTIHAATQRVAEALAKAAPQKHVPNELLVKLKPGADIDAIAKALGAKVVGRNDKLGLYRLQFGDAAATDAALGQLKSNSDVAAVEYNYILDPPVAPQPVAGAPAGAPSLTLNPPGNSGRVIVGLIDTPIQSLGDQLDQFILKQISVTGDTITPSAEPTHATAMAPTILDGIAAQGGSTSAQILPVDVYGNSETATTWNVALGVQAAVDNGATILNLSLGGTSDSAILDDVIQQAIAKGIVVFAAAGNQPVTTPTYPAADSGVIAVAATQGGQLAPYSNYGNFVAIALPGTSVFNVGNQTFVVQGTSPATAYASGIAAGSKSGTSLTWAQIVAAMQQKFPVPQKSN